MSNGYTRAFAMAAPVAPATAKPHGGMGASLEATPIVNMSVYVGRATIGAPKDW